LERKAVSGIMLVLLLTGMLTLASAVEIVNTTTTTIATESSISYRGTCDTWYSDTDAKIVQSNWRVVITENGKAIFFMKFIELNIWEETPGTYDYLIVKMGTDDVQATSDGFIIRGTSLWWKNEVLTYTLETEITISATNYTTQFRVDFDGNWITGSLTP